MTTPQWPHIDRKTDTGTWPIPGDPPLTIREHVARAYRAGLLNADSSACRELDDRIARLFGQTWVLDIEERAEPTEDVTTSEAAILACVHRDTIRRWACTKHPCVAGRMLLPRFGRRGRETTYLAVHVVEAAKTARAYRLNSATPVTAGLQDHRDRVTLRPLEGD